MTTPTIAAYDRLTGRCVAKLYTTDAFTIGLRLRERLAEKYDCDADDLWTVEGSDGGEYITLPNGQVLEVRWGGVSLPDAIEPADPEYTSLQRAVADLMAEPQS